MGRVIAVAVDVQLGHLQLQPQGGIGPGSGFTGAYVQVLQHIMPLHPHGVHQVFRLQHFQQVNDRIPLHGLKSVIVIVAQRLPRSGAFPGGPEGDGQEILSREGKPGAVCPVQPWAALSRLNGFIDDIPGIDHAGETGIHMLHHIMNIIFQPGQQHFF